MAKGIRINGAEVVLNMEVVLIVVIYTSDVQTQITSLSFTLSTLQRFLSLLPLSVSFSVCLSPVSVNHCLNSHVAQRAAGPRCNQVLALRVQEQKTNAQRSSSLLIYAQKTSNTVMNNNPMHGNCSINPSMSVPSPHRNSRESCH